MTSPSFFLHFLYIYSMVAHNRTLLYIRLLRPIFHGLIILWLFWWAILLRSKTDLIPWVQLKIPVVDMIETMIFALIAVCLFFLIWVSKDVYELKKPLHAYYKRFLETRFRWMMLLFAIAYLWFWYVFVSGISRFVLIWAGVWFLIIGTLFDWIRNSLNHHIETRNPYTISLLSNHIQLQEQVIKSLDLYDIYQIVEDKDTDITLAVWNYTKDELQTYADIARIGWQGFYHISDHLQLEDLISRPTRLWPIMALEYSPSPLEWRRQVIKRLFDLIVSGFAIIVLSPFMLLIAIGIKMDSNGQILYRHTRVGKNWNTFNFSKFRTMYTHMSVGDTYGGAEALKLKEELMDSDANVRKGPLQKIEDDPRVTSFWYFLRKTSLDELPNLFNVFVWNLSLVWPRPHEPFEVAKYENRQKRLLAIKPGMTGYAQLFGRDQLPFEEEAKLDLYYTQNRSMFLDIYVLVSTIKVMFRGR